MKLSRATIILVLLFGGVPAAHAYIGPGAGFTMVASFFIFFVAIAMAFVTLLTWPVRWAAKALLQRRRLRKSRIKRVIILGLDGQDPDLTDQFMAEGILPNFSRLRDHGSFTRLQTSYPAESPVAWSCFQTGCNPGKHRIYDFLVPNRKTMLPELSSARVDGPARAQAGQIPHPRPAAAVDAPERPFWQILSGMDLQHITGSHHLPGEAKESCSAMAVPTSKAARAPSIITHHASDQRPGQRDATAIDARTGSCGQAHRAGKHGGGRWGDPGPV
jgi:hypothetical protein